MKYILTFFVFISLNCNNFHSSQYLRTNFTTKSSFQDVDILIRNYKIIDNDSFSPVILLEITGRKNIKDAVSESKLFRNVFFFNEKLVKENAIIIDFEFDEIESKFIPNNNFNPIAILTFGMIGGSIQDLKNSFTLKLMIYNYRKELLKEKKFKFSESIEIKNDEIKSFSEMSKLKYLFMISSIEEVMK